MKELMRQGLTSLAVVVAVVAAFSSFLRPEAQAPAARFVRASDGKPNLNGIWQAVNSANYDLEDHAAYAGPLIAPGAIGAVPGGYGVVEGGEIPYRPEALTKKKANFE